MTNIDPTGRPDRPVEDGQYDMDQERVVEQDAEQALDRPQLDPDEEETLAGDEGALEEDELGADEDGYI